MGKSRTSVYIEEETLQAALRRLVDLRAEGVRANLSELAEAGLERLLAQGDLGGIILKRRRKRP